MNLSNCFIGQIVRRRRKEPPYTPAYLGYISGLVLDDKGEPMLVVSLARAAPHGIDPRYFVERVYPHEIEAATVLRAEPPSHPGKHV